MEESTKAHKTKQDNRFSAPAQAQAIETSITVPFTKTNDSALLDSHQNTESGDVRLSRSINRSSQSSNHPSMQTCRTHPNHLSAQTPTDTTRMAPSVHTLTDSTNHSLTNASQITQYDCSSVIHKRSSLARARRSIIHRPQTYTTTVRRFTEPVATSAGRP